MAGMLRPGSLAFTVLLAYLTSFGPLSVDLFVPSMPDIGRALGAPTSQLQLTISLYLVGYAIGQIVYGPISDRIGRVPVLLIAFAIYCAASAICWLAPNIEILIAGRIGQALGVSAGPVVVRAIVRDQHEGVHAGHQLSLMTIFMGFMPILAPLAGGMLLTLYGWRASFVLQFACGVLALYLVWRCIARTRPPTPASMFELLAQYRVIGTNPVFLANVIMGGFAYSGLFAWIAGSPFVLQNLQGLTPLQFSICYAASCTGFMAGGMLGTRLVMRVGLDKTAGIGAVILAVSGAGMIFAVLLGEWLPVLMTIAMGFHLCGMGLVFSQAAAAALTPFPKSAGVASALIGFVQQCSGAVMGAIVGNSLGATAWPMAWGVAVAGGGCLLSWALTRRVRTALN